jgi:hypothetical protein
MSQQKLRRIKADFFVFEHNSREHRCLLAAIFVSVRPIDDVILRLVLACLD